MLPSEAQAIARETVPGCGEPRVTLLASGLLNDTYRVDRDARSFSLRIAVEGSRGAISERLFEFALLQEAARRSLAPPLVRGDAKRGFLVQEWVLGEPWSAVAARAPNNIARLAALLRRVHQLPQPAPQRVKSPRAWVEHYAAALARLGIGIAVPLAQAAETWLASLEALPQQPAVVCHSDLHLMNLLEGAAPVAGSQALTLLDWEYAHVSEAFWDLAGWSANNDFPDPLLHSLLSGYLGREPQASEWARGKLLVWLYDYVCLLWSQLYLRAHGGAGAETIAARVGILQERLGE